MKQVPFIKYTSYGNNFVILDETRESVLSETEKSKFAYQATNINFGVGSDNFLIVQPCTPQILSDINSTRSYWKDLPDSINADYIFRMFEPDGIEAFSCGNGLMSVADYLFRQYGDQHVKMLTEIPTGRPKVVSIGTDPEKETNWANMVRPRRIPDKMVDLSIRKSIDDNFDIIQDIPIKMLRRSDQIRFHSDDSLLTISGYLVFSGEPHLVLFVDSGFSNAELGNRVFLSRPNCNSSLNHGEKRAGTSSDLVDFIGNYFVREYSDLFPVGININFVRRIKNSEILEYRCFERGVNHETLACGTGALAVAFVARELGVVHDNKVIIWPHRCRWDDPTAEILVEENKSGWLLNGNPCMLLKGTFMWG
jgi:diaminopimelate epimerase